MHAASESKAHGKIHRVQRESTNTKQNNEEHRVKQRKIEEDASKRDKLRKIEQNSCTSESEKAERTKRKTRTKTGIESGNRTLQQ